MGANKINSFRGIEEMKGAVSFEFAVGMWSLWPVVDPPPLKSFWIFLAVLSSISIYTFGYIGKVFPLLMVGFKNFRAGWSVLKFSATGAG